MRSSCSVTSCGVPSTVTVEKKLKAYSSFANRTGMRGTKCVARSGVRHRLAMHTAHERLGDSVPVLDVRPNPPWVEHHSKDVRVSSRSAVAEQQVKEAPCRLVRHDDVPAPIHDEGGKRLLLRDDRVDSRANRLQIGGVET